MGVLLTVVEGLTVGRNCQGRKSMQMLGDLIGGAMKGEMKRLTEYRRGWGGTMRHAELH